ncbi:hypothetical protein L3Y34_014235 [Caenorhabditis briggsae]|uniref:WD and tetratricopeptide repeats protein 1 n=2 Tax=Caenorhabditis briggsae TaxID=6238 RepID=A0AAE9IX94_CAEBR|nr:hypothetical protein L3Y34_014235 [Caenorhabditis briggsae]
MLTALEKRYEKARFGSLFPDIIDENMLIDSFECCDTLEGHTGCVNTLRWNRNGQLLASGSDDRHVKIWRAGLEVESLATGHVGNVFAVEFLPGSSDRKLVTGAADHIVFLHDLEVKNGGKRRWELEGRVKRLCTLEQESTLWWAAVEAVEGVQQFDTRLEAPEVVVRTVNEDSHGCKSVAVSDVKPHLIVVGFDETPVRLYDRRNFSNPLLVLNPLDADADTFQTTHVAFNKTGTEVVVNQGNSGGICVFPIDSYDAPRTMERLNDVLGGDGEPTISSNNLPYPDLREAGHMMLKEKKFSKAVDYYSELISRNYKDRAFRSVCYSNRATALLVRRQRGDTYACIRDCVKALEIHQGNSKALFRLIKSFTSLETPEYAKTCVEVFRKWYPNRETEAIDNMEKDVVMLKENEDQNNLASKPGYMDYTQRFVGTSNCQTDIKEANFFGSRDQYIVAGSDCGHMFVWNRDTSRLQGIWKADDHILNIVQPHPEAFLIATSGIDDDVLIWEPVLEKEEVEGFITRRHADPFEFIKNYKETYGVRHQTLRQFQRHGQQCVQS